VRSQFPTIIHWGWPDLVVLYNVAFIPLIGDKHPAALGTRLFDSWPELRLTIEKHARSFAPSITAPALMHRWIHPSGKSSLPGVEHTTMQSWGPNRTDWNVIDVPQRGNRRLRRDLSPGDIGDTFEVHRADRL